MQLILTDIQPVRARRSDPMTSHKAAKRSLEFSDSHEARALHVLRLHGPMTAHEIGQLVGLRVDQLDRRRADMARRNLVRWLMDENGKPVERDGFGVWEAM